MTVAVLITPTTLGWKVVLTDGRELARFTGLGAKQRAIRFVDSLGRVR